ncbi:hypothetical protein P7L54_10325 [Acinetobacter bereziniae]|uniref:hypothetical protein n=1 Tax=Acinetobacter bereziniae TaxID=106648 RepID=UPI0019040411|nr:hypothetical protein [Acinetobacter bereziniae]MDG3556346.1 hypothetical protein [Acinetobacter bereziniae]MDP6000442.1 hypothetical protein [Acinetobacter bereziniae]QQC79826.1 hypothetical protein I9192_17955 [Acinetobacter bereziniae]UUN92911.1 hypothetical protein I9189_017825 [Acinetobacter bereziniae]WMW73977.1 hypothetical protein RG306_17120 [Acinetobacter bereziniae]
MNLESLPLFPQFMRVLCSYQISYFQVSDIFSKVLLLGVENNNINYQNIYRLVQRFVKEGYLAIDDTKTSYKTYSETGEMRRLRDRLCSESKDTIDALISEKEQLELEISSLSSEIELYEELKQSYPNLQFIIEQLKEKNTKHLSYLKNKKNALCSLIMHLP